MRHTVRVQLGLHLDEDEAALNEKAAAALGLGAEAVEQVQIARKSIDARRGDVRIAYALDVTLVPGVPMPASAQPAPEREALVMPRGDKALAHPPVVVGAGPCGLFAALVLAREGYRPIVLERGEDLSKRRARVNRFFTGGAHDEESNVLFGDGGAGAFSDGKLTARGRDAAAAFVLDALCDHGAPQEIRALHKPHLGTDGLGVVIAAIKQSVLRHGGQWHNGAKVDGLACRGEQIVGVRYTQGGARTTLGCGCVVFATGHSARDTYRMLFEEGIAMAFKPFAVGVRIEHPQEVIDAAQYGRHAGQEKLGAADYALTARHRGRGVYTFCMCPGGMVIPSVSEAGHLCVNGMSYRRRDMPNANAAVVVQVNHADCGDGVFAGFEFQRHFERLAFEQASGYQAPVQRVEDFIARRPSVRIGSVKPSYPRGHVLSDLNQCLPPFVADGVAGGIEQFERRLRGFGMGDAILTGVEMRTSAPVRVLRREDGQSETLEGLYPAGEGAGYAGGIVSAAADGVKAALAIMARYAPPPS